MTVVRFLTGLFFGVCALVASYVFAVAGMYVWTYFVTIVPYDPYAYFSCPFSGKCIEFGRELYRPTLILAAGIFVDAALAVCGVVFFKDKIKMPEKLKPLFRNIGTKATEFFAFLKGKISRRARFPNGTD